MSKIIDPFEGKDFSAGFVTDAQIISTNVLMGFICHWSGIAGAVAGTNIELEVNNVQDSLDGGWQTSPNWFFDITNGTGKDGFRGLGVIEFKYLRFRFNGAITGTIVGGIHMKNIKES